MRVRALGVLAISLLLVSCSSASDTAADPADAVKVPCKTVKSFVDKFLASDLTGAATYATVAAKQFEEIADLDTEFGRFGVVMEQAADDGVVDDFAGYSAMLDYCKSKWD